MLFTVIAVTIYLDVLLLSNLWADYALLHAAAKLTHTPLPKLRALAAALLGAASACVILLPRMPPAAALAFRIGSACAVCAAAFGIRHVKQFFRMTVVFLLLSFFFSGLLLACCMLRQNHTGCIRNCVIYTDISLLTLLAGTAAASAVSAFLAKRAAALPHRRYLLHLRVGTHDLILPALADTGNTLEDVFSGKPVIVCGKLPGLQINPEHAASLRGFRMIPVQTVAGAKLLPAFLPDYAAASENGTKTEYPVDALIAVTDACDTPAVLPAVLLNKL